MTWQDAVDIVTQAPQNSRYRWLCSEDNPNEWERGRYREIVVAMATNTPDPAPSLVTQALSFGKAVAGFIASGLATASDEEIARRRGICEACEFFEPRAEKCRKCGCNVALKAWMMSSACPVGRW